MKITLPALAVVLLSAVSCLHTGRWEKLCDVETYVYEHPDSALQVLRGIDTLSLCGRQERAKYSLLFLTAMDKSGIDTADMRLIRPAVRYYRFHGTAEERARSLYYQGRIYENSGEYNNATISFTKILPYLNDVEDLRLHGMLYSEIARMYNLSFDYDEALTYAKKEYEVYRDGNVSYDYYLATYNYAAASHNAGQTDTADSLYQILLSDADVPESLIPEIQSSYALLLCSLQNRYELALEYFDKALASSGQLYNYNEYGAYAYALAYTGNAQKATDIAGQLKEIAPFEYFSWKCRIDELSGDYRSAYLNLKAAEQYKDTVVDKVLRQSIVKSQRDLYENQGKIAASDAKILRLWMAVITLSAMIAIAVMGIVMYGVYLKRKNERNELIRVTDMALSELKSKVDKHKEEKEKLQAEFYRMYRSQFSRFVEISEAVVEEGVLDSSLSNRHKEVYETAKAMIRSLGSDEEGQKKFEEEINSALNGAMKKLRTDLPGLDESEYRFASHLFAGFSTEMLVALSGYPSVAAIYMKKSRFKKRILQLPDGNANKDMYLQLLK